MNQTQSRIIFFIFAFLLFFHLAEAVFHRETGRPLISAAHPRVGFPFTDDFYFSEIRLIIKKGGLEKTINPIEIIQSNRTFFVSRVYWNLFSRFYLLPRDRFESAAQGVCEMIASQSGETMPSEIEFLVKRNNQSEVRQIYLCK